MKALLFLIAVLIILTLYFQVLRPSSSPDMRSIKINNTEIKAEVADSAAEQYRGLSGRDNLCAECGMLFVHGEPRIQDFVMRGMKFPLDFLFISGGRVVDIHENIPKPEPGRQPRHIRSRQPADMVLELNAGFTAEHGIKAGDNVDFR